MKLPELQDIRKSGLPEIYQLASTPKPDGPLHGVDVLVMDFGKDLQSKLVDPTSGSLSALRKLSAELGAQVTPLLRNLFQRSSDDLGNYSMLLARKLDGKRNASQVGAAANVTDSECGVTVACRFWVPERCSMSH